MYEIIFITGKVGAGKDTIAKYLNDKYNYTVFSYADNLKSVLKYAGWNGCKDLKGRKLLQDVGKAFRRWDRDFWVNKLFKNIINSEVKKICISDVRHHNEIDIFKEKWFELYPDTKAFLFNIIGPNRDIYREMDKETLSDSSETDMDNYRGNYIIINNNREVKYLYCDIDKIMKTIFGY